MRIIDEVGSLKRIAISGHEHPDGDCVGSCMGMALFLRKVMPDAQIDVFLDDFSDALKRNIPGTDTIHFGAIPKDVPAYDAFICLDTASDRLGEAGRLFHQAVRKVNIDHHISNKGCGDVNYIDPQASSACELVYQVIDEDRLDSGIAQALYVGIVTDTGVFRYSNTSETTMRIAGKLLSYGFNFPKIVREVFFEKTFAENQILGKALTLCQSRFDGKCITCILDSDAMKEYGATKKDVDGISSQMVLTEGADCSVFAYQTGPGAYKLSLRSNEIVDVAKAAGLFGGGGHVRAAGASVNGDVKQAMEKICGEIEAQLQAAKKTERSARTEE